MQLEPEGPPEPRFATHTVSLLCWPSGRRLVRVVATTQVPREDPSTLTVRVVLVAGDRERIHATEAMPPRPILDDPQREFRTWTALLAKDTLADGVWRVAVQTDDHHGVQRHDAGVEIAVRRDPNLTPHRLPFSGDGDGGGPFVSLHIPKTAGTTFNQLLRRAFGSGFLQVVDDQVLEKITPCLSGDPSPPDSGALVEPVSCLHGHLLRNRELKTLVRGRWLTWLRDPAQRVISHYRYLCRESQENRNPLRRLVQQDGLSLEEFARLREVRNFQTYFLEPMGLEDFAFVGISDEWDRCQQLFRARYGLAERVVPRRNQNVNPERTTMEPYPVSDELRDIVARHHRRDVALYEAARQRLEPGLSSS